MNTWLKLILPAAIMLMCPFAAAAHPGVGIVQDARGNIYYTDLVQVWKIAPDGQKSVAVPAVHTHELYLDPAGNLYGEDLRYESATETWNDRVWMRSPDGRMRDVIPRRTGFLSDYSFVRDRNGVMYWAESGTAPTIKKRAPNGPVVTIASSGLRLVSWMTALPDGTVYFMDAGDLRRIAPNGRITTVVMKLTSKVPPPAAVSDRHYHMGLWTDATGRVYVAIAGEGVVMRVDAAGKPQVVARSTAPWSVSGGLIDRDGKLWLLEFDTHNEVRARRVDLR
jgi:hypothetical protein